MANTFKQDIKVLSSRTDDKCRLSVIGTFNLLQDNMCEYFDSIQCDGLHLVPSHNCFFVVSKTKVHFDKYFNWLDSVKLITEDESASRVTVNLRTRFVDGGGNTRIDCVQEMCVMDAISRKLRLVDTTPFPMDDDAKVRVKYFSKLPSLDDGELVFSTVVKYTNIDFYHHTNNVEYIRIILDGMPSDMLEKLSMEDIEIHYLMETKLGDKLDVFRVVDDRDIYFEIRREDKVISRAKVSLKEF